MRRSAASTSPTVMENCPSSSFGPRRRSGVHDTRRRSLPQRPQPKPRITRVSIRSGRYAWGARIACLGQQELLPVGLLLVNVVALAGYTVLVVRARTSHSKALWLLANPALLFCVATDTAEPLALAMVMLAITSGSWLPAVLAGTLGLVRESYMTVLGIARRPTLAIAAAAISAISIRLLRARFLGETPFASGGHFTWPVTGYIDGLRSMAWPPAVLTLLILVAVGATFARGFPVSGRWRRASWWATGLLGLCLSALVTSDLINLVRALGAVPILWALEPRRIIATNGDQNCP